MQYWPFDRYANNYYHWHEFRSNDELSFYRPLGLVERTFDADGIYFGGRADINAGLDLEIHSTIIQDQLRTRILLAWTALRLQHVLLMAKAVNGESYASSSNSIQERIFLIDTPKTPDQAIEQASLDIVFVADLYPEVDYENFYYHLQNTGRIIDASKNLAKLYVLPSIRDSDEHSTLRFIFVMAHQITDGLTNHTWLSHFLQLLNQPLTTLKENIFQLSTPASIMEHLPHPQEELYPAITASLARKRWFWAIAIVLRHVKKPAPACFPNPLYRQIPNASTLPSSRTYERLLNYKTQPPPTNSCVAMTKLSHTATKHLHTLCRSTNVSVGAGCFLLVAMAMMQLYEAQTPNLPISERLPFIGSFPINPRPFFSHHAAPNSLMLAFSDGIILPFLPTSLPFAARFRLLVHQAQRQLRGYQKRQYSKSIANPPQSRILPNLHLQLATMLTQKLPQFTDKFTHPDPSASLPPTRNPTMATCGISSVGRSLWRQGEYDLTAPLRPGVDAFVADFRENIQNVRAREGEFLVGIFGGERITVNVSFDEGAVDKMLVKRFGEIMEEILMRVGSGNLWMGEKSFPKGFPKVTQKVEFLCVGTYL